MRFGPLPRMTTAGFVERRDLVLVLVGAVVVRRERRELGRARVDRLVGDAHAGREALRRAPRPRSTSQRYASWPSEKPSRFARRQSARSIAVELRAATSRSRSSTICEDLVEEPRIDAGDLVQPLDRHEPPQRGLDLEDAVGRGDRGREHELVVGERVELALGGIAVEAEPTGLERAHRLLQRLAERAADRHDLADRLHLRAEHRVRRPAASRTPSAGTW